MARLSPNHAARVYLTHAVLTEGTAVNTKPHICEAKCGVEGGRTPDPRLAKPVLYQLSYNPVYSAEEVIRNKRVGLVFALD